MLLELLIGAAAVGLGYNAVKDEESRTKTKGNVAKFIDAAERRIDRKMENGEMDFEEYNEFKEKANRNRETFDKWKSEAEMLNSNDYD